jgi:hypothetical protein
VRGKTTAAASFHRVGNLFVLADLFEERLAKVHGQVEKLTPALPPSPSYGGTGLARAWTHSLPARSGCALSLCKSLFTRSQCVQIAGQLVPQDPTDEPAEKLLERIGIRRTPRND